LTLSAANPCESADPILHHEPPLLKIVLRVPVPKVPVKWSAKKGEITLPAGTTVWTGLDPKASASHIDNSKFLLTVNKYFLLIFFL
jgi:hypothetical protein